jgi:hypothetical protein
LIESKETQVLFDLEQALRIVDDSANSCSSSMVSLPGSLQSSNNNNNSFNSNSLANYLSSNYCSSTESVSTATTATTTQAIISIDGDGMGEPIVKQPETANHLPSPLKSPAKVTFCSESLNEPLTPRFAPNRITAID